MRPSVLLIVRLSDNLCKEISDILTQFGCDIVVEEDVGNGIEHAQKRFFNAIVLDTKAKGMEIKQVIKIFKNLDPNVKIIVTTDSTSKALETDVRQEKIFYYHIDSFDSNDLKLAVKSAITYNKTSFIPN
jgi:DNA-binding NtrC family response regulator